MASVSVRFRPLQPASRRRLALAFVAGPVLWVVAVAVVGAVVHRTDAVELGVAVTAIAFAVSIAVSAIARRRRLREEERAAGAR